jgi:hypothetical protein
MPVAGLRAGRPSRDELPDDAGPGSEVCPDCLLENLIVRRQIRYRTPKSPVLCLEIFKLIDLLKTHPTVKLAPALTRRLGDLLISAERFDRTTFGDYHLGSTKHPDDLLLCEMFSPHF